MLVVRGIGSVINCELAFECIVTPTKQAKVADAGRYEPVLIAPAGPRLKRGLLKSGCKAF